MIAAEALRCAPNLSLVFPRRIPWARGDRRLSRRYPIAADLEYRAVGSDGAAIEGMGRSVNLSANGILFQSDRALRAGMRIELSIAWPARLNDSLALNLRVSGRVSRSDGNCHAIRIRAHEFCLRGKYRLAERPGGSRFRTSGVPDGTVRVAANLPVRHRNQVKAVGVRPTNTA
jgi:PilZ domain